MGIILLKRSFTQHYITVKIYISESEKGLPFLKIFTPNAAERDWSVQVCNSY